MRINTLAFLLFAPSRCLQVSPKIFPPRSRLTFSSLIFIILLQIVVARSGGLTVITNAAPLSLKELCAMALTRYARDKRNLGWKRVQKVLSESTKKSLQFELHALKSAQSGVIGDCAVS